jgi:hypothetical protein
VYYIPFCHVIPYNSLLAKYKGKVAELAVSFDRPYTVAEIKAMLPKEARPGCYDRSINRA